MAGIRFSGLRRAGTSVLLAVALHGAAAADALLTVVRPDGSQVEFDEAKLGWSRLQTATRSRSPGRSWTRASGTSGCIW